MQILNSIKDILKSNITLLLGSHLITWNLIFLGWVGSLIDMIDWSWKFIIQNQTLVGF